MNLPSISRSELAVLKTLWRAGPCTVREAWQALPEDRWVYTTVQTLLQRLESKGYAASTKRARTRIYAAAVTREQLLGGRLGDLSRELCDGATVPLLRGLVSGRALTRGEISDLRGLLDELEADLDRDGEPHPSSKR